MSKKYTCFSCNRKFVDLIKHTKKQHPKLDARSYDFLHIITCAENSTLDLGDATSTQIKAFKKRIEKDQRYIRRMMIWRDIKNWWRK